MIAHGIRREQKFRRDPVGASAPAHQDQHLALPGGQCRRLVGLLAGQRGERAGEQPAFEHERAGDDRPDRRHQVVQPAGFEQQPGSAQLEQTGRVLAGRVAGQDQHPAFRRRGPEAGDGLDAVTVGQSPVQ